MIGVLWSLTRLMLQSSMHECIMIVTNPKLHHDWREDWAGTHMRRVGNNWRITLHKKKARGEVLECMVLHGTMNLVPPTPLPSTNYLILVF